MDRFSYKEVDEVLHQRLENALESRHEAFVQSSQLAALLITTVLKRAAINQNKRQQALTAKKFWAAKTAA